MPSAAVRDEGALQMRPAPCGYSSARIFETVLFFLCQKGKNGFNLPRKERGLCETESASHAAIASEEASSIPFPPGRRKLHIRWLLLPFRKPTAALGRLSVPIRKGKRRPENLSDGSLDSPSTRALLWTCGVGKSQFLPYPKVTAFPPSSRSRAAL